MRARVLGEAFSWIFPIVITAGMLSASDSVVGKAGSVLGGLCLLYLSRMGRTPRASQNSPRGSEPGVESERGSDPGGRGNQ